MSVLNSCKELYQTIKSLYYSILSLKLKIVKLVQNHNKNIASTQVKKFENNRCKNTGYGNKLAEFDFRYS